jgi:glycosyltransferase involved in cell wall biosynthesis
LDQAQSEFEPGLVSIVMPAYNVEKYLGETVDCVFAQSYEKLEVVLVDDGSTDRTLSVARGYGDRIRIVEQSNHGVSYARNVGLAECRGEYVHFLDCDDLLSPQFYERLVEPLVEEPDLDASYCSEEAFEGDWKDRRTVWKSDKSEYEGNLYRTVLLRSNLSPANVLYRRSSIAFVGGFDVTIKTSEDYDFQLRFAHHAKMRRVPEAVYYYRQHPASASRDYPMVCRNRLMVAKRHIEAGEGMETWRAEWRELRRATLAEACASMRFNLKRNLRNGPVFRAEIWKALRFLATTPSALPWLLRGRKGR